MENWPMHPESLSVDDLAKIVEGFKNPDYEVRWQTAATLRGIGFDRVSAVLVDGLESSDEMIAYRAIGIFRELGQDVASAAPAIVELLKRNRGKMEPPLPDHITEILGGLGRAAVPGLLSLLEDPDPEVRSDYNLVINLVGLEPPADEIVPDLLQILERLGNEDGSLIAYILAHYGAAPEVATPILVADLESMCRGLDFSDIDIDVEGSLVIIIEALMSYGASAAAAVPALNRLLNLKHVHVSPGAAGALGTMGPAAESALPMLEEILRTPFREFMRERHPDLKQEENLENLFSQKYAYFQVRAAEAIWNITADASRSVAHLIRFVDEFDRGGSYDYMGVNHALRALARIGPVTEKVLPTLIRVFEEGRGGADALGELGPKAKAALPALYKGMEEEDLSTRLACSWAIYKIGGDPSLAIPVLIEAVEHRTEYHRQAGGLRLAEIGPPAAAAIPALQRSLVDSNSAVRSLAAKAIEAITS